MNGLNKKLLNKLAGVIMVWGMPSMITMGQVPQTFQAAELSLGSFESVFVHTDKPYYLTGETLWFKAYCTNNNGKLSSLSSVLYLELFNQVNEPVAQIKVPLQSGTANGQILLSSSWGTGNYILRAYTAWMRNQEVTNFYHQSITIVNPLSLLSSNMHTEDSTELTPSGNTVITVPQSDQISITTDRETYANRQLVELSISTHDTLESPLDISVAVYPYHSSLETGINIHSALGTGSTIRAVSERSQAVKYFPETVGPVVYGELETVKPKSDLLVSLKGEGARIYSPIFLDSSRFVVQLTSATDYDHLYFWTSDRQNLSVIVDTPFHNRLDRVPSPALAFKNATIKFIESQSVNMQVSNLYQEYAITHGVRSSEEKQVLPFYGVPEFRYNLDDYTRFPGLEEVFREYVKYVSLRRREGILKPFVWDYYANDQSIANNIFFNEPALIMLDGMPVADFELLLEVDPLRIRSIEGVTKKFHVGNEVFHGVVNLRSYQQDFSGKEAFFGVEEIPYSGLQRPLSFFHPDHGNTADHQRIPDRRNTLYWDPQVKISSTSPRQLRFYTGDTTGYYQIVINGLTATEQPIHKTKIFTVQRGNKP